MKKYFLFIVSLSLFVACQSGSKKNTETEKGVLTVTIEPQRYFLEQIVGDAFTINTLVPPGTSPETYEAGSIGDGGDGQESDLLHGRGSGL